MWEDLLQVRSAGVNFYVLRDPKGLYLIDGGFLGGRSSLRRALRERGWDRERIVGIVVTHGHLDHILNVSKLAGESGAWIAAPRLDAPHYEGRPSYRSWAQVGGCLESIGRKLFGFCAFAPTRFLDDGDTLDIWRGLRVVHLPGHTAGHSGLYCEDLKLLFAADLFASYGWFSHLPPRIFNADQSQISGSVSKALALELEGVFPHHADRADPATHLRRLRRMGK